MASFVGTLSILPARVIDPAAGRLSVGGQEVFTSPLGAAMAGEARTVALRPEAATLEIGERAEGSDFRRNRLRGTVEEVSFLGSIVRTRVRVGDFTISLHAFNSSIDAPPERGARVVVAFAPEDLLVLEGV